jgi:hypothetical protein
MKLTIRPIKLDQAQAFVQDWHRHNRDNAGGVWAICAFRGDELIGVAICGRPISQVLQRRGYLEILRVAVLEGCEGACSMLYARCRRIGQLMGYQRFVSYNLPSESGASLEAAGFHRAARVRGRNAAWSNRPGRADHPKQDKFRWEAAA